MASRETGLTLIEIAIGVVLMLIILSVAYPGFIVANDTISTTSQRARLQEAGEKVVTEIVDQIRLGQLTEIGSEGTPPYAVVHPPRTGIALDEITASGAVPWKDDTIRIQYRPTGKVAEEEVRTDLNGDGDTDDDFALGVVEVMTAKGTRPITRRGRVLLGLPGYEGDVDGDGESDPMFKVTGRQLDLELTIVFRDEESGEFRKAALARTLYLRNRQD